MKINRPSMLAGTGVLSLAAIVCMLFWGGADRETDTSSAASVVPPPPASTAGSVPMVSETQGISRILTEWEGKLAVFVEGYSVPDEVFDVYISTFPEEEQVRLRQGIRVADDTELARYLEDYTS